MKAALGTALAALFVTLAPRIAEACAVCGANDAAEVQAAFLGTTVILSILPLALVGGFAWYVVRRARQLNAEDAQARVPDQPAVEAPRRRGARAQA